MATPRVSDQPTTQRQYATQLALSAALTQAVRSLWASTTPLGSGDAWEAFRAALQAVVPRYATSAAVVSLDNYRSARSAAGVVGEARITLLGDVPASKVNAGLDWAARLRDIEADQAKTLAEIEAKILDRVDAAMNKAMLDEARAQTVAAVEGDDRALGYRRVPRPDACYWCIELAIRKTSRTGLAADFKRYGSGGVMEGDEHWGVYKSRASAGQIPPNDSGEVNRFHNNCNCVVEPIFSTDFAVPPWLQDMSALYDTTGAKDFRKALSALRRGDDPAPDPRPVLPSPAAQTEQVAAIADLLARLAA